MALIDEFLQTRDSWETRAEITGSTLHEAPIAQTIALAMRHDCLLEICAMDTGRMRGEHVRLALTELVCPLIQSKSLNESFPARIAKFDYSRRVKTVPVGTVWKPAISPFFP